MSSISKITSSMAGIVPVTFPPSYPYQVTSTDRYMVVDTTEDRTLIFPPSPPTGYSISFKDGNGMAGANPITLEGNGNTIDSSTDYVIQFNWGFAGFRFNGLEWNVINN